MLNSKIIYCYIFAFVFLLSSCMKTNTFQKVENIKGLQWSSKQKIKFNIDITDTNATYTAYFNLRHTDAYLFSNIWINTLLVDPSAKILDNARIEILLAKENGEWLTRGMGDIWEHKKILFEKMKFKTKGSYQIQISHDMRTDPLPQILSVGLTLEKK